MQCQKRHFVRSERSRMATTLAAGTLAAVFVAGCGSSGAQPTHTAVPPSTSAPTMTRTPQPTVTPTVSASSTATQPGVSSSASGYRVSVTSVEGARFPRSIVTITLAIERVDTENARSLRQWETPLPFDFELQGLTSTGGDSIQPTGDRDNPTILLHFHYSLHGHPDEPVEITLNTLRFADRSGEQTQRITVEDRWHLRFVPSELEA